MIEFKRWQSCTWNIMGDSITEDNKYLNEIKDMLELKQVHNYGISATCLASVSETDRDSMAYRVREMDKSAELVTVFGGTNDWGNRGGKPLGQYGDTSPTTIYGTIDTIITTILKDNPATRLTFITPLQRNYNGAGYTDKSWSETKENARGVKLIEIVDAILEVCHKYAVLVLDFYRTSGITDINLEHWCYDGLHPNKKGYERINKQTALFLNQ